MISIKKFQLNKDEYIEIQAPILENKFNYYYKPSSKLHKYDEVIAFLNDTYGQQIVLVQDMLDLVLEQLKGQLKNAVDNKLVLPSIINIGELGLNYNIEMHKEDDEFFNYANYSIWSYKTLQTWIYTKNDNIYLEVAPSYPWLYVEPEEGENYISFDVFIKTYKPILVTELDQFLVKKWIQECQDLSNKLDKDHEQMLEDLSMYKNLFINALNRNEIDLLGGEVTFSDLDTTFEEQKDLKDLDGEIQITYWEKNTNQVVYVIQILLKNNNFTIKVIKDLEWDLPIFEENASSLDDFFATLQQAINRIFT